MKPSVFIIKAYQAVWHPIYFGFRDAGIELVRCRLEPSCSEYAMQAFEKMPFFRALKATARRLMDCHKKGA